MSWSVHKPEPGGPSLGELIRRHRRASKPVMSQTELAAQLGVDQSTVAKWEGGSGISTHRLPALAEWLGVSVAEAFEMSLRRSPPPAPPVVDDEGPPPARDLDPLELLSTNDLAALFKVTKPWVYAAVERGELPAIKVGGHLRFRRYELERYLTERIRKAHASCPPSSHGSQRGAQRP